MPVSYREMAPTIRTLPKVLPQEGERAYSVDGVRWQGEAGSGRCGLMDQALEVLCWRRPFTMPDGRCS